MRALLAVVLAGLLITVGSGCTSASPQPSFIPVASSESAAKRVNDLGAGVRVIFPVQPAAHSRLVVRTDGAPPRTAGLRAFATPVHLELIGQKVPKGTVIEFPIPRGLDQDAGDLGIATWSSGSGTWQPQAVSIDRAHGVVRVTTDHFSWWQPWTWDWAAIGASVDQHVSQLLGERADGPECTRGQPIPSWVGGMAGIENQDALPIRACAEGDHGVLAVEITNNRPYGQVLDYGDPSRRAWTWQQPAGAAADAGRNAFVNALLGGGKLYLPPLSRASIGVRQLPAGSNTVFRIDVDSASILGDVLSATGGSVLSAAATPLAGAILAKCGGSLVTQSFDRQDSSSATGVFGLLGTMSDCAKAALAQLGSTKALDGVKISQLEAVFSTFKRIDRANEYVLFGDTEWKLADLWQDLRVFGMGELGAGFSIYSRSVAQPEATHPPAAPSALPAPPQDPAPQPAPPAPSAPAPSAPGPSAPGPVPAPVQPKGYTVQVSVVGGAWARTGTDDGGWNTAGVRPGNGAWWYPNGLGVAVGCTTPGAEYTVTWDDGRVERWHWWAKVTDGKYVQVGALNEVQADSDLGLPRC